MSIQLNQSPETTIFMANGQFLLYIQCGIAKHVFTKELSNSHQRIECKTLSSTIHSK